MNQLRVLVADDDQGLRHSVRAALELTGRFAVEEAFDGVNAVEKAKASPFHIVILDVDMPRMRGLDALRIIKEHDPSAIVLVVTAFASIDDAVLAVKEGAYNYIAKPIKSEDLVALIDKAIQTNSLISNVAASAPILTEAGRKIVGNTAQMQKVFNIINKLSKVDTPVLIRGASGTGKELVARAIHANSARKDNRFVAINCSAIPENLFESELFGHEKGAFTGADQRKIGKFQFAENGTLFLDEIGDLPPPMQVKFLRVLQEKVFSPVGANREIESRVRVIAATNRPLEQMIEQGTFREDLFYRLNVIPIFLPPLADRKNDIDHLVNSFIKKFNGAYGKKVVTATPQAMQALKKYSWPGNIRELENAIEHAFILESSNQLNLASFPEYFLEATGSAAALSAVQATEPQPTAVATGSDIEEFADLTATQGMSENLDADDIIESAEPSSPSDVSEGLDFNLHKEAFEKEFIIKALKAFKGRINQTALHANIPKKTLLRKIEKYGIVAKDYAD